MFRRSSPKGPNHRDAFFEEYRKREQKRRISLIVSGIVSLLAIVGIFFYDDIARVSASFSSDTPSTSANTEWTTESTEQTLPSEPIVEDSPPAPVEEDLGPLADNSTPESLPIEEDPIIESPEPQAPPVLEPEEINPEPITRGEETESLPPVTRSEPQTIPVSEFGDKIYKMADKMPNYPGGLSARKRFVKRNMNSKVASLLSNTNKTKVYLEFVVEPNGELTSIRVVHGVNNNEVNQEAIRLIEEMPRWESGRVGGERVRVYYTISIDFKQT